MLGSLLVKKKKKSKVKVCSLGKYLVLFQISSNLIKSVWIWTLISHNAISCIHLKILYHKHETAHSTTDLIIRFQIGSVSSLMWSNQSKKEGKKKSCTSGRSKFSSSKMKHCHWPSKVTQIKPATHSHNIPNSPGGWAVFAAAGVDDWLVVIETAKGKFLPDGLSLIPLGLTGKEKWH